MKAARGLRTGGAQCAFSIKVRSHPRTYVDVSAPLLLPYMTERRNIAPLAVWRTAFVLCIYHEFY
jgi:hypothetical protein